jgi:DNA polymerase
LKAGCADLIFPNVMKLTSSTIRGCIIAPPGKKLAVADLSNIEGRGLAWLAEEKWKLQAFRDFDAGIGHDLYKLAYAKAFRVSPESVVHDQRQIGKVMELMLGYGGGVGAFITGAATYGFDIEEMAENAWDYLPGEQVHEAEGFLEWVNKKRMSRFGLSDRAFLVCDVFKRLWRAAHPRTASFWGELEAAVRQAINNRGNTFECRKLRVRRDGAWLRIVLPSGRALCYPFPKISDEGEISYMGMNQYTRKWSRIKTYGGKLAENVTQAFARDVMYYNMPAIEDAGFELLLSVHDEDITQCPDTERFTATQLSSIMSTVPAWCKGLPLAAAGFESYRYRKG